MGVFRMKIQIKQTVAFQLLVMANLFDYNFNKILGNVLESIDYIYKTNNFL